MADEKDRLGSKLHDVEKARENQWARQRDVELLEKMRKRVSTDVVSALQGITGSENRGRRADACVPGRTWRVARRGGVEGGAEGAKKNAWRPDPPDRCAMTNQRR